ncbi:MAG: transcriptional repressor [Alphaproteobacteria bacterium]
MNTTAKTKSQPAKSPRLQNNNMGLAELLKKHGIRPTRQRLAILHWLYPLGADQVVAAHHTAESLHQRSQKEGVQISLATIYNTLNHFSRAALLNRVTTGQGRSFYDTQTSHHHHVFYEETSTLEDVSDIEETISQLKKTNQNSQNQQVEVIVRIKNSPATKEKI